MLKPTPKKRLGGGFLNLKEGQQRMALVLIILLVLMLLGALPGFSTHSYGYGPSGLLGVVLIVVLVLFLTGRL